MLTAPKAPKVLKVLRFDGPCGPEGYGLPHRGNDSLDFQSSDDSLQHGYHRLTIICASLCSYKLCSLV